MMALAHVKKNLPSILKSLLNALQMSNDSYLQCFRALVLWYIPCHFI